MDVVSNWNAKNGGKKMGKAVQPSRQQTDLAEVIELLLDKGIVINADIAVSIGDTQLLGIQLRAAIASFETAATYGLEFPEGTDMNRLAEAVGDPELAEMDRPNPVIDPTRGVNVTADDDESVSEPDSDAADSETTTDTQDDGEIDTRGEDRIGNRHGHRPDPRRPFSDETAEIGDSDERDDTTADDERVESGVDDTADTESATEEDEHDEDQHTEESESETNGEQDTEDSQP